MKIKKPPPEGKSSPHHEINAFIHSLENAGSDHEIGAILRTALPEWQWPRTDLQYWIRVLNRLDDILADICASYNLKDGHVQLNEFTPKTKDLLLAILDFTRILLEHATNKRTWNGYDRIHDLYLTRDMDVLIANLRLALRPALLYKRQDAVGMERLLQLAQCWNTREFGLDMAALASDTTDVPADLESATFQFYRQADPSVNAAPPATPARTEAGGVPELQQHHGEGLVTLQLGNVAQSDKDLIDIFADAVETHKIPLSAQLGLLQRLRITWAINKPAERQRLLMVRLYAIACLVPTATSESSLQSKFFVYEPELVPQIAQLLHPDHAVSWTTRSAALYALDGLFKARNKSMEVCNAIHVSVSHGIILSMLRKATEDLASETPKMSKEFLDALFVFINSLQSQQHTGTALINAGIIPVGLEFAKVAAKTHHITLTSRAVTLLDSLCYGFNSATTSFLQNHGMTVFVELLEKLAEAGISKAEQLQAEGQELQHSPTNGLLAPNQGALLRALLRCVARVIGITGTQGELRNLIDSTLPKTLKRLIEHRRNVGPQIYSLALNIMTSFIHNEPTSLSILQEQGLPDAFYASIADEATLEPAFDVFNSMPNALGALCLNDTGREQLRARADVLPRLFFPFTSEKHANMLCERENASLYGAAIDELVRHQPELKEQILNCMVDMLRQLVAIGQKYQAPNSDSAELTMVDATEAAPSQPEASASASEDVQMGGEGSQNTRISTETSTDDKSKKENKPSLRSLKAKDNAFLVHVDAAGRFLEAYAQTQSHAKDFVKTDGLDLVCQLSTLPCIPPNFENTSACTSITTFLKVIGDTTPAPVLTSLVKTVQGALDKVRFLWEELSPTSKLGDWLSPPDAETLERSNQSCSALITFQVACSLLEVVFPHLAYTHSRGTITQALQILNSTQDSAETTAPPPHSFLLSLGKMHRSCMREHVMLKLQYADNTEESSQQSQQQSTAAGETPQPSASTSVNPSIGLAGSTAPQPSSSSTSKHNWTLVKETLAATIASLEGVFSSVIARPPPRRNPDAPFHAQAVLTSQAIATIFADHLNVPESGNPMVDIAYATVAIKAVSSMLGREKWVVNSSASLLVRFWQMDGLSRLLKLYTGFLDAAASVVPEQIQEQQSVSTNAEPKLRVLQAFGGMRVALDLLERFSLSKIPELIPSGRFEPTPDHFDAGLFLVKVRLAMLPKLADTWRSPVIQQAPPNIVRTLFRTIVNILDGRGEDGSNQSEPSGTGVFNALQSLGGFGRRQTQHPTNERIQQITDMGFPRPAAVAALQRFNSNVMSATEYLISHPDFVASHADDGTATPAETVSGEGAAGEVPSERQEPSTTDQQMEVEPSAPSDQPSAQQLRDNLSQQRMEVRKSFLSEALELVGVYKHLVFDLQEACFKLEDDKKPEDEQLLTMLLNRLASREQQVLAEPRVADSVSSELRLLALLSSDRMLRTRVERHIEKIASISTQYLSVPLDAEHPPVGWLSYPLLIAENVFSITSSPKHADLAVSSSTIPKTDLTSLARGPEFYDLREKVFNTCIHLVTAPTCSDENLIAVLRLTALLTRNPTYAHKLISKNILPQIIAKVVNSNGESCQELVMLILRHVVELPAILDQIIRSDIQHWLHRQRGRAVDMSSFVLGNKHAALRDPSAFALAALDLCKLRVTRGEPQAVFDGPFHVELIQDSEQSKDKSNEQAPAELGEASSTQSTSKEPIVQHQPVDLDANNKGQIDSVVHLLISQLLSLHNVIVTETAAAPVAVEGQTEEAAKAVTAAADGLYKRWAQARFFMSALAELLYSYDVCKSSLLRFNDNAKDPSFLKFLLNHIIANGEADKEKKSSPIKQLLIKDWASLILVSLCATPVSPFEDAAPSSEPSEDQRQVRRVVLTALDEALRFSLEESKTTSQRYSRLSALAECTYNLLIGTAPSGSVAPRKTRSPSGDVNEDIAKLMIELDLPATLISALSDVDLNFPHVRGLINWVLRPIQLLSRIAKRAGPPKASPDSQQQSSTDAHGHDSSRLADYQGFESESGEEESEDLSESETQDDNRDEEMPDVYRNSALGMFQGELEGGSHQRPDEGMMMEDDDMEEDDMMMDDGGAIEDLAPSDESDLSDEEDLEPVSEHNDEDGDHTMVQDDDDDDDAHDDDDEDDDDDILEDDDDDDSSASEESDPEDSHHNHRRHHHHSEFDDANESADMLDFEMEDGADPMVIEMDGDPPAGILDSFGPGAQGEIGTDGPVVLDLNVEDPDAARNGAPPLDNEDDSDEDEELDAGEDVDNLFHDARDDGEDDEDDDEDGWEQVQQMDDFNLPPVPRELLRIDLTNDGGIGGLSLSGRGHHHHHHRRGNREPRPVLLAGQGQSVRDIQQHPMLLDRGSRESDQDSNRARQLARGPYAHLLSQIGEELGDNAFSLFETVLGSVSAMQTQLTGGQYSLVTEDGQVAADLRLDAPTRGGSDRHNRQRAELRINNLEGFVPQQRNAPTALSPASTYLRWDQEGRTFQGAAAHAERTGSLVVHLINSMLLRAVKDAEELQKSEQQEKEQREKREAEEKAKREKEAQEQKEKAEAQKQQEEQAQQEQRQLDTQQQSQQQPSAVEDTATAMQGVSVQDQDPLAEVMALARSLGAQTTSSTSTGEQHTSTAMALDELSAESTADQPRAGASSDAASQERSEQDRVTVTIHGSTVDITNTGIDPTFLEALPDEMREEVVSQHLRENAAAAAAARPSGAGTSENQAESSISREFLDALPPDIRAEVIQQEAVEHSRQSRIRELRSTDEDDVEGEIQAADMDPASFLASLVGGDPELRREVLLQQIQEGGQGFMGTLPSNVLTEAQGLAQRLPGRGPLSGEMPAGLLLPPGAGRLPASLESMLGMGSGGGSSRGQRGLIDALHALGGGSTSTHKPKTVPREPVQMLDRPGVATLVRLLFFPQQLEKGVLQSVLRNLCDYPKSRNEIVNQLLLILQDGTKDNHAVDKSFSHVSQRASKAMTPKSTPAKRPRDTSALTATPGGSQSGTNSGILLHVPGENVPNLVAQRCLEAFKYLVASNSAVSQYFLTEQESLAALARKTARKSIGGSGKGKEKSAEALLPLVILLNLLERPSILSGSAIMDALTSLLANVTRPLLILSKAPPPTEKQQSTAPGKEDSTAESGSSGTANESSSTAPPPANQSVSTHEAGMTTTGTDNISPTPAASGEQSSRSNKRREEPSESPFEKQLREKPPQLAPQSLALVVNILDGDEVTSKTFRATLALISHLTPLPDARQVISDELIKRARQHGSGLFPDLQAISAALSKATTQNDLPASLVSRFSSASSLQAKLLRVLQTIHYIHSIRPQSAPKEDKDPESGLTPTEASVNDIYLSFDFGQIWDTLSNCLTHIEDNNNLSHMGTVLLPLIESLMVVSRYAARPPPTPPSVSKGGRGGGPLSPTALTSPHEATSPLESLQARFATFTQQHRKLLNLMIKNNPSLMSGSFSILVHNPAVLDFDNKVNYFNQRLHKPNHRHLYQTLPVAVRRKYIFEDSFHHLGPARKTPQQIKYGKLAVRFYEEEGVDAGGVTREWYSTLARSIFNPDYALFQPSSSDQLVYQPNPHSYVNPDHLPFFTFVGRIIGKSIFDGRLLEAFFTKAFYKHLLGLPVDLRDLESVDPDNYRSLVWMLENPIEGILELTFSIEADEWGVQKIVDLKPGGRDIAVTDENKREYVDLLVRHRLTDSIQEQIDAFKSGFSSIVPSELVSIFNAYELQLLISGLPDIDVDEWRANTVYQNYSASSSPVVWFWRAVRSFSSEERAKLLQFVTGSARVPLEGFGALQGVSGNTKFTVTAAHKTDVLPAAHSCFNQLDLPNFSSYEELRRMLLLAINETEGFGFA